MDDKEGCDKGYTGHMKGKLLYSIIEPLVIPNSVGAADKSEEAWAGD